MLLLRGREAVMRYFRPSLLENGVTEQQWRVLRALSSVEEMEVMMLADATLIVYFIPYLYMFAAAIAMRRRLAQTQGALALPGGAAGSWLINGIGALTTLVAIVLALIPPPDTHDRTAFFVKVFVGSFGFLVAGWVLYEIAARRRARMQIA